VALLSLFNRRSTNRLEPQAARRQEEGSSWLWAEMPPCLSSTANQGPSAGRGSVDRLIFGAFLTNICGRALHPRCSASSRHDAGINKRLSAKLVAKAPRACARVIPRTLPTFSFFLGPMID